MMAAILLCASLVGVTEEQALSTWLGRGVGVQQAREAVAQWEALAKETNRAAHHVRTAVAWHWLALVMAEEPGFSADTRHATFLESATAAQAAQRADPANAEGYFWEAASRARAAELKGIANSVWLLPVLLVRMRQAEERDARLFFGGIHRARALAITRTPSLILMSLGGSLQDAEDWYAKAATVEPELVGTFVMWAELKARRGDDGGARTMLRKALTAPPSTNPEVEGWNRLERRYGEALLRRLGQ